MTVGSMVPAHDHEEPVTREQTMLRIALVVLGFALVAWLKWSLAVFIVILLLSIVLHELGHYLGARWGGMKPTEYFIGFGPRIFSWRRGETEYGLKPILLGAYVKVPGMTNLEEVDPVDEPRTYRAQSYGRRFRMVLAGPAMNLLIALVGFVAFFAFYAEQQATDTGTPLFDVASAGPAGAAGLADGDRLLSVDGVQFASITDVVDYVKARPGQTVAVLVERDGTRQTIPVELARQHPDTGEAVGFLGVRFIGDVTTIDRNLPEAVQAGFTEFGHQIGQTVVGIGKVFSPSGLNDLFNMVTGQETDDPTRRPTSMVGISQLGSDVVESGVRDTLIVTASLNLALGMFNLLPILPFDGGHLLVATYERLRSRRGQRYQADFAKVLPFFGPIIIVIVFVVFSAIYLDVR